MACEQSMMTLKDVVTVTPDQTVEEAMDLLHEKNLRALPVIDKDNGLLGVFGSHDLLESLLPVSVTMQDGLSRLDFVVGAAPGIAKRLRNRLQDKVSGVMEKNPFVVSPETPTWEAIRLVVHHGSPLSVVKDGKLVGLITEQALIEALEDIKQKGELD